MRLRLVRVPELLLGLAHRRLQLVLERVLGLGLRLLARGLLLLLDALLLAALLGLVGFLLDPV